MNVTLYAPTQLFFWVSLVVAAIGLIIYFAGAQALGFWLALIGYIVLSVACMRKPT